MPCRLLLPPTDKQPWIRPKHPWHKSQHTVLTSIICNNMGNNLRSHNKTTGDVITFLRVDALSIQCAASSSTLLKEKKNLILQGYRSHTDIAGTAKRFLRFFLLYNSFYFRQKLHLSFTVKHDFASAIVLTFLIFNSTLVGKKRSHHTCILSLLLAEQLFDFVFLWH